MGRRSRGEQRADEVLARLPESHWKQLRHVSPGTRTDVTIDHVLVGPSGVHVIDYRSADGEVVVDGATVTHAGTPLQAETEAVTRAAACVAEAMPERYRARIRPVLCFTGDQPLADLAGGVLVTSSATIEHILRSSPVVLSTSEIGEAFRFLGARLSVVPTPADALRGRRSTGWRWKVLAAATAAALLGAVTLGADVVNVALLG